VKRRRTTFPEIYPQPKLLAHTQKQKVWGLTPISRDGKSLGFGSMKYEISEQ